jgi:choline transport protein
MADEKIAVPEKHRARDEEGGSGEDIIAAVEGDVVLNAAGYRDELKRQYSLIGLAGVALTVDNAWVALGSSISVSIRTTSSPVSLSIPQPCKELSLIFWFPQ